MKKIIPFILLFIYSLITVSAQSVKEKKDPVGQWKFDAPFAPEGYTSGKIDVSYTENKFSSAITFTGSDYKIPGEKVRVEKDTISFLIFVEGTDVTITLKMENDTIMAGKAVYSEGEIPLTLIRDQTNK